MRGSKLQFVRPFAIVMVCAMAVLVYPGFAHADLQSEIAKKKALQESINQANAAKQQQQTVAVQLQQEVNKLSSQISTTQNLIAKMDADIRATQNSIVELQQQIEDRTIQVTQEKAKLEETFATMYIDDQSATLPFFIQDGTISDAVARAQTEQSIAEQIQQKATEIAALKQQLEQQKIEVEAKQNTLKTTQEQQKAQKQALDKQAALKNDLLQNSISSIADLNTTVQSYQSALRAVDGKISEFLAAMQAQSGYSAASGDLVVSNSHSWHYYQTDARWANQVLDPGSNDSDTFAESGCLVTSIAQVATSFGITVTPPQMLERLRSAGAMYGDLVSWGGVSASLNGRLRFVGGGKERISWGAVDASLAAGKPVIVHINKGQFGHWVVIGGKVGDKYAVEDPYFTAGRVYPATWIDYMARLQPS